MRQLCLHLFLFLATATAYSQDSLSLETRAAAAGTVGVQLVVTMDNPISEVGGMSFGLDHDESVLDVVGLEYIGPHDYGNELVLVNLEPGFASIVVLIDLAMPLELIAPPGPYPVVVAEYDVMPAAPAGLSPVTFAQVGSPPVVVELATPLGPVTPVTSPGGVQVSELGLNGTIRNELWLPNEGSDNVTAIEFGPTTPSTLDPTGSDFIPVAVARGTGGEVWVPFQGSMTLVRYDSNTLDTTPPPPPTATSIPFGGVGVLTSPTAVAVDSMGNVWVCDDLGGLSDSLTKFDRAGAILLGAGGLLGPAPEVGNGARGIAVDQLDNVWVASETDDELTKLNPNGEVAFVVSVVGGPYGVAVDRDGFVWVTLRNSGEVQRRSSSGTLVETFDLNELLDGCTMPMTPATGAEPTAIAIRGDRDLVDGNYVAIQEAWVVVEGTSSVPPNDPVDRLVRIRPGDGCSELLAAQILDPTGAMGDVPSGVAIDGDGDIWVTSQGSNEAREFFADGDPGDIVSVGTAPEFLGDASGYVLANVIHPDEDFDDDLFTNADEIDSSSNPFDDMSVPIEVFPVDLLCSAVGFSVTVGWVNNDNYDQITIYRDDVIVQNFPNLMPPLPTEFVDTVFDSGVYEYRVEASTMGAPLPGVSICQVAVGVGAAGPPTTIQVGDVATTIRDITAVPGAVPPDPHYYATDAASGRILVLDDDFVVLNILESPFMSLCTMMFTGCTTPTACQATSGIAYRQADPGGQDTLFVASAHPCLPNPTLAEMDLNGVVLGSAEVSNTSTGLNPIAAMDFVRGPVVTDNLMLLVSGPDSCDVIILTSIPSPVPTNIDAILALQLTYPGGMAGVAGAAFSVDDPNTLDYSSGGVGVSLAFFVDDANLPLTGPSNTGPAIEEYTVIPGPDVASTGVVVPLVGLTGENSFGGFDLTGSLSADDDTDVLTICGETSSAIYEVALINDCNGNGIADSVDVMSGDCNTNGIPDECDVDCNFNGVPDDCDISMGTSLDCNGNGVPDDCDTAGGMDDCNSNGIPDSCEPDCNANDIPDDCDIAAPTSLDCQPNGIPDECEVDCNMNNVPDDCDIALGTSLDCNMNGVPDECDISSITSIDCQPNGIPDECEIDCNGNNVPDDCDISAGTSLDCQPNGIPDECDILMGPSVDTNGNDVPDECEPTFIRGNCNDDMSSNIADAIFLLNALFGGAAAPGCDDACDVNDDGSMNIADAVALLNALFGGGTPLDPNCQLDGASDGLDCAVFNQCP